MLRSLVGTVHDSQPTENTGTTCQISLGPYRYICGFSQGISQAAGYQELRMAGSSIGPGAHEVRLLLTVPRSGCNVRQGMPNMASSTISLWRGATDSYLHTTTFKSTNGQTSRSKMSARWLSRRALFRPDVSFLES